MAAAFVDEGGFAADGAVEGGVGFNRTDMVDPAVSGDAEPAQDRWGGPVMRPRLPECQSRPARSTSWM
jgi:hypothetical protein